MAEYGIDEREYIYTGDCSMVTGDNLVFMGGLDSPGVKFVSRMPATFAMVDTLVSKAVSKNMWTDIGILSEWIFW